MASDLHNAIMNIPAVPPKDANINQVLSYKIGHRDARHAAAELALASHTGEAEPVAVPLTALHLIEDAAQAHDQCRAVVHMALSLAEVYVARAAILAASPNAPVELIGQSSAATMEYLGDLLSNMDAVEEGDEWLDPIFEAAQARWPDATPPAATPAAPGRGADWNGHAMKEETPYNLGWTAGWNAHARAHPAPVAAPAHVGDSRFESWFSEKNMAALGTKQLARDAYAAGMGDPLAAPAPASEAVAQSIAIDFKQATELLEMFGDQPCEITLTAYPKDEHHFEEGFSIAAGLYAHYTDCPEEGGNYLGVADHDATPAGDSADAPVQQAGVVEVCFDCDIADCRHIRARRAALKTAPTAAPGDAG